LFSGTGWAGTERGRVVAGELSVDDGTIESGSFASRVCAAVRVGVAEPVVASAPFGWSVWIETVRIFFGLGAPGTARVGVGDDVVVSGAFAADVSAGGLALGISGRTVVGGGVEDAGLFEAARAGKPTTVPGPPAAGGSGKIGTVDTGRGAEFTGARISTGRSSRGTKRSPEVALSVFESV
jgi:hypothetical protein